MVAQRNQARPIRSREERRAVASNNVDLQSQDGASDQSPAESAGTQPSALPAKKRGTRPKRRVSSDGYLSFNCQFTENTYHALTRASVDLGRHGYDICEEAVVEFLKAQGYMVSYGGDSGLAVSPSPTET